MKTQLPFTRRRFLKTSLGAGAGLVLVTQLSGCQNPLRQSAALNAKPQPGEFAPNVYLSINPDNTVTITVPRSEMGQGVRTALPMIVAEELDADWETIIVETAPAGEQYGPQFTGGSQSIVLFWKPLRQAGASARQMLVTAAAQEWGVAPNSCSTQQGMVTHTESGRALKYGELAELASMLPVPEAETLTLKKPEEFKIIGQPLKRVDDPLIVQGKAVYGFDIKVPNMQYAAIARSPVFGGTLAGYKDSAARAVAGVIDVVEIDNAVAVVATNTWAAMQGKNALDVIWDEGENGSTNSETIRQGVLEKLPAGVAIGNDASTAKDTGKIQVLYEIPYQAHAAMEPMNCVAHVQSNQIDVWAPTQNPLEAHRVAQSPTGGKYMKYLRRLVTGVPLENITVNVSLMGGGFGRRLNVDYVSEAVQVSQATGSPIQVVWTREDDIQHDFYHPVSYHFISAELDPQAKMKRESFHGPGHIPYGAWRSINEFDIGFIKESFVDELAHALNKDPFELRMERINNPRLKAVLELAAEKGNWGEPLPDGHGRGIAAFSTWGATHTAEVAEVSVSSNGQIKVNRVVCAIDCGIVVNPDMVKAQVEGGIVFALTSAIKSKITLKNGRVEQSNFNNYPLLQMSEMPNIEVYIVPSAEAPTGVGEMSGPPLTPAVANAIFNATGIRVRHIPILPQDLKQA